MSMTRSVFMVYDVLNRNHVNQLKPCRARLGEDYE